ncbi:acinetodin/klebsidin/J25 family lasso peptide [Achromobacter xylosoxidans]
MSGQCSCVRRTSQINFFVLGIDRLTRHSINRMTDFRCTLCSPLSTEEYAMQTTRPIQSDSEIQILSIATPATKLTQGGGGPTPEYFLMPIDPAWLQANLPNTGKYN